MLKVNAAPRQAPKLVWEEFLSFFFSPSLFTFLPLLYFIRLSFLFPLIFIYYRRILHDGIIRSLLTRTRTAGKRTRNVTREP